MDTLDYLRLLRRRWWVVGAVLALALGAAFATLPARTEGSTAPIATSYTATHVLLQAPDAATPINFPLTILFGTVGEVPRAVAERLGQPAAQGPVLAQQVQMTADKDVAALRVTATGTDPARTAELANAFAEETREFLRSRAQEDRDVEAAELQTQLGRLNAQVNQLVRRIAAAGGSERAPLLAAQQSAFTNRYQSAFDRFTALQEQGPVRSDLITLQEAVPVPVVAQGSPVPTSPAGRLGLAAVLGLLLGVGLVLVLDRLDTRLRVREDIEEASRLPVVAEIPQLSRDQRRSSDVVVVTDPGGPAAEAYRALRSSLLLVPSRPVQLGDNVETVVATDWSPPRVVLVTSAAPSDGKTSTVVNLAATLAESGRSVIVIDADFRKPSANRYLGVPRSAGLSELLAEHVAGGLADVLHDTLVPGVRMVTSGTASRHPATLLARMGSILREAVTLADVVIVDTAPLLVANDATDIVPHVDTVLVVAQAAKTTAAQAERMSELLARLGVPVLGVVLQASGEASGVGSYYGPRKRRGNGYGYGITPGAELEEPAGGRRARARQRKDGDGREAVVTDAGAAARPAATPTQTAQPGAARPEAAPAPPPAGPSRDEWEDDRSRPAPPGSGASGASLPPPALGGTRFQPGVGAEGTNTTNGHPAAYPQAEWRAQPLSGGGAPADGNPDDRTAESPRPGDDPPRP